MLLDVAVFAASVSLNGVSEAFGVHEINNHVMSHIQQVDIAPVTVPDATQAAAHLTLAPVDPTLMPQLGGRNLLSQLALLPRGEVASFVSENPSTIANLLVNQHLPGRIGLVGGVTAEKQAELAGFSARGHRKPRRSPL